MKHQVRLIKLLMHPVSLSLMVTVIIVLLFIPTPAKYKLQIEDETTTHKTTLICYDDLDGNGFSDKICAQDYASENQVASLLIWYNPGLFFNEWDFPGSFSFGQKSFIKTGDYDNDGKKGGLPPLHSFRFSFPEYHQEPKIENRRHHHPVYYHCYILERQTKS